MIRICPDDTVSDSQHNMVQLTKMDYNMVMTMKIVVIIRICTQLLF